MTWQGSILEFEALSKPEIVRIESMSLFGDVVQAINISVA